MDPRAKQLAEKVLEYSISLQDDDNLLIQFYPENVQYASLLGRLARQRGANVEYDSMSFDPVLTASLLQRDDPVEWDEEFKRRCDIYRWCTNRVLVDSEHDESDFTHVTNFESLIAKYNEKVVGPAKKVLYRRDEHGNEVVKWNIVGFPTEKKAKEIGMPYADYEKFVYGATLVDWNKMAESMAGYKKALDYASHVHINVPGLTDLHLSLGDRAGNICSGKRNMPDGEFYYAPVEDSVEGYITYQIPSKRDGCIFEGIKLVFENGGVVASSTSNGTDSQLEELLNVAGARFLGELGIGCNYGIQKAIMETLFDEKIGGTIHTAVGSPIGNDLRNGGGLNESELHWDIVCDLRRDESNLDIFPGGQIYVDGKLVQKNGEWLI